MPHMRRITQAQVETFILGRGVRDKTSWASWTKLGMSSGHELGCLKLPV
eukprot:SAG11_NODE_1431_length_4937_cov_1.954940_4_plen_49_part_00